MACPGVLAYAEGMRDLTDAQIKENLRRYRLVNGVESADPSSERITSFDYCYNHFQAFRENRAALASEAELERSCLHLGFYLASWGMLRGSSELLQKSLRHYVPLIELIAETKEDVWAVDIDQYTEDNIERLISLERDIRRVISGTRAATDTLSTKIMLGVFGNVPAFDSFFRAGFHVSGFGPQALRDIGQFYCRHKDAFKTPIFTMNFHKRKAPERRYPKAKIMDMVFFVEGIG